MYEKGNWIIKNIITVFPKILISYRFSIWRLYWLFYIETILTFLEIHYIEKIYRIHQCFFKLYGFYIEILYGYNIPWLLGYS